MSQIHCICLLFCQSINKLGYVRPYDTTFVSITKPSIIDLYQHEHLSLSSEMTI